MSDYTFVWKNGGWWLKITTVAQLFDYWDKTDGRWSETLEHLIDSVEFSPIGKHHADILTYAVGKYGIKNELSMTQAVSNFAGNVKGQQLNYLLQKGTLFFNARGGYHFPLSKEKCAYQFCQRKKLVFPNYKESDIRIKSFPGGEHFYAYIGDMQVRNDDGTELKWSTYEAAYMQAVELVTMKERDL